MVKQKDLTLTFPVVKSLLRVSATSFDNVRNYRLFHVGTVVIRLNV